MEEYFPSSLLIIDVVLTLISIAFVTVIYKYTRGKAPGLQTQLDLQIFDNVRIWIIFSVSIIMVLAIRVFYGKLEFQSAQVIIAFLSLILHLIIAALTVTLILKGILVFKSNWLEEVPDEKVQKISRATIGVYVITLQMSNSVWRYVNGATPLPTMIFLTDDNEPM